MLTKILCSGILSFLLSVSLTASSQTVQPIPSIEPFTMNAGGGSVNAGDYFFDWSIGEASIIETFETPNLMFTGGILQPLTERSGFLDNTTLPWFKEEIAIYPVPTHTILDVDIKIINTGQVTMHLYDQRGLPIITKTFDYVGVNGHQKINMTNLTAGIYYLTVMLGGKNVYPLLRKGTFKIQKL